jgi:hypothetical protein
MELVLRILMMLLGVAARYVDSPAELFAARSVRIFAVTARYVHSAAVAARSVRMSNLSITNGACPHSISSFRAHCSDGGMPME